MRKKLNKKILCIVLNLLLLIAWSGCSNDEAGQHYFNDVISDESEEVIAEEKEPTLESADTVSMTDFTMRLFQESLKEDENILISPLSVISALGMTANGAASDTRLQMEQTFGISVPELNEYLYAYEEALPEDSEKCKLNMANAIWFRDTEELTVEDDFLQTNEKYYGATVEQAPFDESTLKEINNWVSDNTDGMIDSILNEISPTAMLYLINAVAFDAQWEEVYKEHQVREAEFTKEDGSKQDVQLMYSKENVYLQDDKAVGFMKYYAGQKYAFAALLPNEGISVSEYTDSLTGECLNKTLTDVSHKSVEVAIPKFKSEYSIEMSEALKTMGMTDAFDMDKADFAEMGSLEGGNLYIDKVLHKTFIEVDEQGTKAAAVTAVLANETTSLEEKPMRIYLDRPFVYMIVDCENNVPVFIGAVQEMEEPSTPKVSLSMVGDILLHTPVEESAKQEDGTYNFDAIFSETEELIQAADLALVNQEVIIGGEELGVSGYPAFNAPYEVVDALVKAGFDVVCHGTNHALDKGARGLTNCLDFWEENYPETVVLGIHDSQESQDNIYIYEQDGIRIAILNYTYGTNGIPLPSDMPYGVDLLEEEKVVADIKLAEETADFTVVCPHWGTEYELGISSMQEKWTRIFLENGVDLVLGTHPHVIEPIEWVRDEETGHEMLVYYSLGNFVNWTSGTRAGVANRMVGGMAQVTVEKNENGEVYIAEYDVEPLVCHLQEGTNGVTVYPLDEYTAELAAANEIVKQDPAFSLEYCRELCQKVWPEKAFLKFSMSK